MKEQNKVLRGIGIVLSILLVVASFYLLYQLIKINVLPTKLLFLITIVFVLLDAIFALLLCYYTRAVVSKIICVVITLVLVFGSCMGGYYISKTGSLLTNITNVTKHAKNTVSVVVKQSSDIKNKSQLNGLSVGILRTIGTQGSSKALKELSKDGIVMNQSEYDSLSAMLEAFYNGEVDSIIINESSRSQILDMESYADFDNNTRVVYQTSYKVENTDKANAVSDITSKPFNVLISGSDTRGGFDENGRSDVIMVATINPKTSTILLTSVPRDFYVTTACDAADGCMQGALDKITHTGIHGTNTTKRTVEQLLGIEINYTFKVGFDAVTELVDAVGGVDVTVAPGYAVNNFNSLSGFSVHEGVNHLNGEQALAFARERYAYTEGDRQRTKNQQLVLMGIVDKITSPSIVQNYSSIMDAMSNTFSTTMSSSEISDLIKYQINNNPKWKMEQYMVDGTGDTLMCAELGDAANVMVPDQSTVKMAKDKINAVLAGKSADDVK
ncbi:LCP family protein [Holdemanella porci]|uniref:LCP family protein n=1 Tax=Holdemanella porci TaxID=2652276 RepID=UPI001D14C158|nr:LCP family protein [Holdemanella porci]MCC3360383.1 LCP family protein [Holdemanella porci]